MKKKIWDQIKKRRKRQTDRQTDWQKDRQTEKGKHIQKGCKNKHRLVWFYGISNLLGYLMPNPTYTNRYIRYIWFVNKILYR